MGVKGKKNETTVYKHLTISATSEIGGYKSDTELPEDNGMIVEEDHVNAVYGENVYQAEEDNIALVEKDNFREEISQFMDWADGIKANGYSLFLLYYGKGLWLF